MATGASRFKRWFGRTWLRVAGWTLTGSEPAERKLVLIAAPHDTNWDLPFALTAAWALGLDLRWTGKKSLFRRPFGGIMRALGGVPIDRGNPAGVVAAIVDAFGEHEGLVLAIPPEGTRSRAPYWKSGFHRIAVGAGVPIACGFIDYPNRRVGVGGLFLPTGDPRIDMETIRSFYREVGRLPEATVAAMRLREEVEQGEGERIAPAGD
jgi:1-acyl-sn-glycerol-3-phosphate acyltransferase